MRRNALAYYDFELNTAVKYFKVQATLECGSLQQSVGALKKGICFEIRHFINFVF
jgi:hypothetical protein